MNLQEFYQSISQAITGQTLVIGLELADQSLLDLMLALGLSEISECSVGWKGDQVQIDGQSPLADWDGGRLFRVRILSAQKGEKIVNEAAFWSDYSGSLGDFFGRARMGEMLVRDSGQDTDWISPLADLQISQPVIRFSSGDEWENLPLRFSAQIQQPVQPPWDRYGYLLGGVQRLEGKLNQQGIFELEAPLTKQLSGLFPCVKMALLLENGIRGIMDIWHPLQSEVGLRVRLRLPELDTVDFTIPLFRWDAEWTLTADFPKGLGVADVSNLMLELFGIGGSTDALCLPADTALNQFKLYRLSMLNQRQDLSLSLRYLIMEFALAKPWSLPVPYMTLDRLYIFFEISKGDGKKLSDLLTARAGGQVSVMLGSYKLTLSLEMELPSREFIAQAELSQEGSQTPGLQDLAGTMGVALPSMWQHAENRLGQVTVWGAMEARSFAIEAELYDLLSFVVGDLTFSLDSLKAGGQADTNGFSFYIQGDMSFGSGEERFTLFLKAAYRNLGWVFSGGLKEGVVDIGQLLTQMFQIQNPARDIFSLQLSELDVQYETETGRFALTAAFEAGWHIQLLGKQLVLGGRIQVLQQDQVLDVAALAYLTLGDFLVLAQINQVQQEKERSYLFRLQYGAAYLQAAWFYRNQDEILAVSLGGMSLGQLMEALVHMVNPNKRYHLPSPWDVLNKIQLSRFLLELNVTQNQATFLYRADLNLAGLLYLDSLGVRYDMDQRKLYFVLTGSLLGVTYGEDDPITWDAMDGRPPANSAENERTFQLHYLGLGQHLKNDGITQAESVTEAMSALQSQLTPEQLAAGVAFDAGTNWLFGADFTVDSMVRLQLILNDPSLYGLLVTVQGKQGSVLETLDGLGIELLCKKLSDTVYLFRGELLVPKRYRTFELGAVSLTLGTIRMDLYTNGGFCVDLGFPYNLDFSRSFVLEWGVFTGRGGVYLGVMRQVSVPNLPAAINGSFSPIMTLGIGLSVGLGRSFDLGIVKGGLSAEVFGLFEGVLAVFHPEGGEKKESLYYYVKAVAGITGRLYLSVDFKIISVQASAMIQASAMLTIQACKATEVELELSLKLSASIKILFIKISFSFSFHQKVTFTFGSDQIAPWETGEGKGLPVRARRYIPEFLEPPALEMQTIRLSLVPMFYLANPVLDAAAPKQYGAAFLMTMDRTALEQWGGLLAEWALSGVEGDVITAEAAREWTPDLADAITYKELDDFLCKNVRISCDIHWVEAENRLRAKREGEAEGFVFPMLPGLALSFGTDDKMTTINYWTWQMVSGSYFDFLTSYFRELDPNQNRVETNGAALETGPMPISQAFFLDYFQMFFREVIERIKQPFTQWNTTLGVVTAAKRYDLPVVQILRQNPELQLTPGLRLTLPSVVWLTLPMDSLEQITRRFGCEPKALWESVKEETFLLDNGLALEYGAGKLDNSAACFTLEQAAAFLFVRFYEEETPEEFFYAGDLIRLNPELDIHWQETTPGGRTLTLPEGAGSYRTMRGDTPERIGKYLHLLRMERGSLTSWRDFYEDICRRNGAQPQDVLKTIQFEVPQVRMAQDTSLAELARRIYPDEADDALPGAQLWAAPVLKCNVPIRIPGAVCQVEQEGGAPVRVTDLLAKLPCTEEELSAAIIDDNAFCPAELSLCGAAQIPKQELKQTITENAAEIGAMLSRLLLQGLTVPPPEADTADPEPLFQVLGQMFPLEQPQQEYTLRVTAGQEEYLWIQPGEQTQRMTWPEIESRLPSGHFSSLASAWQPMDDFALSPQYFTLQDSAIWRQPEGQGYLYSFSEAVQRVVREANVPPVLVDEQGAAQPGRWGCLLPVTIAKSGTDGIFAVYGADALKRRALHALLSARGVSVHFLYQASAVSKGDPDFWEYDWSDLNSCLIKTNLSTETHMSALRALKGEDKSYIAALSQPEQLLRMLWECSTVGGGGYFLRLQTEEGQTLPEDLFQSDTTAQLWILAQSVQENLPRECVNCVTLSAVPKDGTVLSLVTQDPAQQVEQPVFPVGCIGLCSQQPTPSDAPENELYMHSLFQITGYQILANDHYEESHRSAPLMPEETETAWQYHAVVPVYRYLQGQEKDNPYLTVGKQSVIALEQRDVLGNTLRIGETQIVPCYNDVLIGVGQYPAAKVSYALLGSAQAPVLRLHCHTAVPPSCNSESAAYQRSAARQLACADIRAFVSSPVNQQRFSLAEQKQEGVSYLDRLREYVEALADAMEGTSAPPDDLEFDFGLDMKQYPLPAEIFRMEARITVQRGESLAPAGAAQSVDTVIFPSCAKEQEEKEQSLAEFCDAACKALPNLYLAQNADEDGILYGVSHGPEGLIRQLSVFPMQYTALTTTGQQQSVEAPEFYALRPLYHGLLSRTARVRSLSNDYTWGESYESVTFSDVDMELWARQFLADVEALLSPDQLKKAVVASTEALNQLIAGKETLAQAIAGQMKPLRTGGAEVQEKWRSFMTDRLKRSLTDGYVTDVTAVYGLDFETADQSLYRLEGTACHTMAGTQVVMGKAENNCREIAACFTNDFQAKSQPLHADLLFTELEYHILSDEDGYESSEWLRFVKPVRPDHKKPDQSSDLDSALDLPNPLRECPQPPVLTGHTCSIHFSADREKGRFRALSEESVRWDYQLTFRFPYKEQDTLKIRVEFEALELAKRTAVGRDLFDALAEYNLSRDSLWEPLAGQAGESPAYQAAFAAFAGMTRQTAALWQAWTTASEIGTKRCSDHAALAYSCTAEGTLNASGAQFRVTSTEEGKAFWAQLGLAEQEPLLEAALDGEELELRFTMQNLPLFSCAQAVPSVSVVRNQNLLSGEDFSLEVCDDFIYRTQEVSLQPLLVSGEYNEVYTIASLSAPTVTQETMVQAVSALYQALGLAHPGLEAEVSVCYDYRLTLGETGPRIELPVTFLASTPTVDSQAGTSWVQTLADNLYQWYQQMQPSDQDCGLRFHVKLYRSGERKYLLRFSHLRVNLKKSDKK